MQYQLDKYHSLTKSYKKYYPFNIATTSFIYPDLYVPNVRMLGPFVDEIELLLFESAPVRSLFSKKVINELNLLARDLDISYNIHLPTDISISDPAPRRQFQAVDTLVAIMERLAALSPTSYTLHVPCRICPADTDEMRKWQDVVYRNLAKLLLSGIPAKKIAIETLDYGPDLITCITGELNLSICLDIGHLIIYGADIPSVFNDCAESVSIIHLHGVKEGKDHGPLDQLPDNLLRFLVQKLKTFDGTVSLEVFNYIDLSSSLSFLERCWNDR